MQPTEGMSIPRRTLDVEDYIDIVRRHKGWIFGPFLLTLVVSVVGVYMWPDKYTSTAIIRVVPQQVPEQMVQAAVNQQMGQRITSMLQTILSRSVLTNIINTYGLYPKERTRQPIEDLVEDMKNNQIKIQPVTSFGNGGDQQHAVPAFSISFSYENRMMAQKVVSDIAGRFLDENQRNRQNSTYETTTFMKDELEQAKKELDEVEGKLQAFQTANNGRLPDQMDANMRELQALQTQLGIIGTNISRDTSDKLMMTNQISILKDKQAAIAKEQPVEQQTLAYKEKNDKLAEAERDVTNVQTQLDLLLQRYKDNYPEVQTARGRLEIAKKRRDELLKEDTATKKTEAATSAPAIVRAQTPMQIRELRDLDAQIRTLSANIEAKDLEIANYNKEIARVNAQINTYSARVETVPAGAREYGDLLREREIAKQKYVDLDAKLQKSQIAQDMEGRKQGENLELLDPASLPLTPTEPKRPMVISIGAGLGLMLGIVIAGALEMKDSSLKNLKDVRAYTQMAILGSIPLLENDFVVRRRKRLAWLGWTTASLAEVVIMSGSIVYYYATKA